MRRSLNAVCHHQNCLFSREGVRSRIGEQHLVYRLVGMLVLIRDVEELCLSCPVVSADEVLYLCWKVVLLSQFQSFSNMTYYYLCRLYARHVVQRVHSSRLVLCKECRVSHLSDVVIERSCTHKLCFCSDAVCYLSREIADGDGGLECTWCHLT